jgi:hypothetical protein
MENLFENVVDNTKNNTPAILLVDASGSVKTNYTLSKTIFAKMQEIISNLSFDKFRLIFWNSNNETIRQPQNAFGNGVLKFMHVIEKSKIAQPFTLATTKIQSNCLTFPHIGFNAIPKEWISNKEPTHIYFITDGQMGYSNCDYTMLSNLKRDLKNSIESLFKNNNNVHLHIITVEAKNIDFNQVESLSFAAGGDVFNVIQNNNLTNFITEFKSYTPNNENGYHHINTVIPPSGYIPFRQQFFSETKMNLFMKYVYELVNNTDSEDELLKIVQSLSTTIKYATKDKPLKIVENITNTFCSMFNNTALDPSIVQFVLEDTVKLESRGQAIVFSEYRAKMKNLYKQAQDLLLQNTKNATGLTGNFISFPINNVILTGSSSLVTETINLNNTNYPNSSVTVENIKVPVLPLVTNQKLSTLNEQCVRQYIRAIISKQYSVNALEDIVMYYVMAICLKAFVSDINDTYKKSYQVLAEIMLKKKRLNSDITELSRLEDGELPIPNNGRIESFYGFMDKVKTLLKLECEPMTLWYLLCIALGNKNMIIKQLIHCKDSITKDFGDVNNDQLIELAKNRIDKLSVFEFPMEAMLDYTCAITLEDTSSTGGYKFKTHTTMTGSTCSPIYVLSGVGYTSLLDQENCYCPICYTNLTSDNFEDVGPKVVREITKDNVFGENIVDPFTSYQVRTNINTVSNNTYSVPTSSSNGTCKIAKKLLIVMKGTVGAGKTTYSSKLQEKIEELGATCINVGTDKYCKDGVPINQAVQMVTNEIRSVNNLDPTKCNTVVVIVDTCGEKNNGNIIFDYNFNGWKKVNVFPNHNKNNLKGYLAWSLRNVLNRPNTSNDSKFWLNPVSAGVSTCVDVHYRKAVALFGKKNVTKVNGSVMDSVLNMIKVDADEYQKYLDEYQKIDDHVDKIISKNI